MHCSANRLVPCAVQKLTQSSTSRKQTLCFPCAPKLGQANVSVVSGALEALQPHRFCLRVCCDSQMILRHIMTMKTFSRGAHLRAPMSLHMCHTPPCDEITVARFSFVRKILDSVFQSEPPCHAVLLFSSSAVSFGIPAFLQGFCRVQFAEFWLVVC